MRFSKTLTGKPSKRRFNSASFNFRIVDVVCSFKMLFIVVLLIFAIALFGLIFAKDSYINMELNAYQKTLREPWLERIVALIYK
ncbi:GrBNV gp58-like protein-like protein [Mauternbach virus]|uniref:GrBNV gp58-like protein-like protein n=1 Tax=Mauternbach virus TaxID=2486603 RepID=A0A3G3E8D9_9VIRU|nr:GrBNV gp58-like protein-like protein [Mauternbach virus]AYP97983.1 GrBNV gp58-like protein-like protein [Mauternbach virus]